MKELFLKFYGVSVCLRSEAESVLSALAFDFDCFLDAAEEPGPRAPDIVFDLSLSSETAPAGRDHGWKIAALSGLEARRAVRYADGSRFLYDYSARKGAIESSSEERLRELAYLAVLSRAGEALDLRGLHRVHAYGFEHSGQAGLLLMSRGGGKSTLALEMLRSSKAGFFSDDAPLVGEDAIVRAFPLRMGFLPGTDLMGIPRERISDFRRARYGPKKLVSALFFHGRIAAQAPLRWLLIGRRSTSRGPRIEPASRALAAAYLARDLVIGLGVAQMAEYTIRPTPRGAALLARIAAKRTRAAFKLAGACRPAVFHLGADPAENARALLDFIERNT